MDEPIHVSYENGGGAPSSSGGGDFWENSNHVVDGDLDEPGINVDLLAEAFFNDTAAAVDGNLEEGGVFGMNGGELLQYQQQEPGLLPGQAAPIEDDFPESQAFTEPLQQQQQQQQSFLFAGNADNMFGQQQQPQVALVASAPAPMSNSHTQQQQQTQQFVAIAPALPNMTPEQQQQAAAVAASAWVTAGTSQNNTNDNGNGQGVVTPMPNPFLALAGSMPMATREQFFAQAFAQRAQSRKGRQMSVEQAERRRERNRQLAKKTRDKKKTHMEELQQQVLELQRANAELKHMVKNNIEDSNNILDQCDAIDKVPETVWEACGTDRQEIAADDFDMVSSIQKSQTAFVITDPSFEDNPIVFVSPDFLAMTGYSREQVIGRNCRFLQGTHTCPDKVNEIRQALAHGEDVGVTMINYKADGTPFWNRLFIAAVRDINDNIVNYMGVAVRVARPEPGDPEHDKELQ
eukprot:CAMPEP_0172471426 /NCGR_PEP_ID=MMETSP1065-20121228/67810_1 /TAXON_ID=265537 /ORGANISM="Amphiprora paludosa, Strain CCMP125" /LENGTH=461 /DNA_ID=CAMNT_0013229521 /DNA_START=100 /DNA_END=1485 /DNA_ORIENTATION=-